VYRKVRAHHAAIHEQKKKLSGCLDDMYRLFEPDLRNAAGDIRGPAPGPGHALQTTHLIAEGVLAFAIEGWLKEKQLPEVDDAADPAEGVKRLFNYAYTRMQWVQIGDHRKMQRWKKNEERVRDHLGAGEAGESDDAVEWDDARAAFLDDLGAMKKQSPAEADAFILYELVGYSYDQVARVLGYSKGTARNNHRNACKIVKKKWPTFRSRAERDGGEP
jgi:DNA-directed RNA polymerase specialized sigma24 family protein